MDNVKKNVLLVCDGFPLFEVFPPFLNNVDKKHAVDCEVVAEGKTVAAPVQKTTRALNTTMSRFLPIPFHSINLFFRMRMPEGARGFQAEGPRMWVLV